MEKGLEIGIARSEGGKSVKKQLQYSRKERVVLCPCLEQVERYGRAGHVTGLCYRVNHTYWIGGEVTPKIKVEKLWMEVYFTKIEKVRRGAG